MRENCTSRLSERAEAGRKPDLSRLYSDEADEQSRWPGGGIGGAKAGDQGERGSAKHAPDLEPGSRDPGAGPHTESQKKEQFTSLLHHITVDMLRTAFYALKRVNSLPTVTPFSRPIATPAERIDLST